MPNIIIRTAQTQDLASIVAIYNSAIPSRQSTADLNPVSIEDRQAWFYAHQNNPNRPIYVMEHNQEIIAWGSFSDYCARPAYHISVEISIYVHPKQRGKKRGQTLLTYMTKQASYLGIQNIIAVIFGHNLASLKLFERNQFQQWGKLPNVCQLDHQLADIIIMGKKLTGTHEPFQAATK